MKYWQRLYFWHECGGNKFLRTLNLILLSKCLDIFCTDLKTFFNF